MFDIIVNFINDMIDKIKGFIESRSDNTVNNKIYNLLLLGFIVYIILQLLNIFKININYSI
jgi:hypothetical protein